MCGSYRGELTIRSWELKVKINLRMTGYSIDYASIEIAE